MGTKERAGFSRRDFFKSAAITGVGLSAMGALAACAPKPKDANAEGGSISSGAAASLGDVVWTKETDVVVVGFGGAGSAAAIEAKQAGAEVVVLEVNQQGGGSTAANGGYIMMGGTDLQKKFNVEDSVENYYAYLSAAAGENANQEALKLVCDSSPDLYRWCVECGMDFESGTCDVERYMAGNKAGMSLAYSGNERARRFATLANPAPRGHMVQPGASGKDMFAALQKKVESLGIEVLYETPGSYLVMDEQGRVAGIAASNGKEELFIKANKGVVLTCGGFVDNAEMLDACYPYTNKRGPQLTTAGSEDGSGILMGAAVGGALQGMGSFQIGYALVTMAESLANGIIVDETGRRIVAEDEYNSFVGKAIIQASTSHCYLIVDDESLKAATTSRLGDPLVTSASFDEIAQKIKVSQDVFRTMLNFYNESASLGEDREFGKNKKFLKPMGEGTYHVFEAGSEKCYTASCGGLKIDLEARVLKNDGEVIPGLFAAGRNAGTIYGWYMGSGSSMADVFTFGRIAGKGAASA